MTVKRLRGSISKKEKLMKKKKTTKNECFMKSETQ